MTDYDANENDVRDESSVSKVTRRGAIAALGLGGLAALGGGSASGQVGGGPESDEISHLLSRFYEGDEADLPSAGVEGRRFVVLDDGGTYDSGTILRDDGSSWAPINLGVESLDADSVSTVNADITSFPASYVLYTDGVEITAVPQQNPAGPELSRYTGETDIGTLLDKLTKHELPPQGDPSEGAGRICLKRGEYPGTLNETRLPIHTWIVGEMASHYDLSHDDIPAEVPGVLLNASGTAFVPESKDGTQVMYSAVKNIQIEGDGSGTGFDDSGDSQGGTWDWLRLENLSVANFDRAFLFSDSTEDRPIVAKWCQFRRWESKSQAGKANRFEHCTLNGPIQLRGGLANDCLFHASGERYLDGIVEALDDAVIKGSRFKKVGNNNEQGRCMTLKDRSASIGNYLFNSGQNAFDRFIQVGGAGDRVRILGNSDTAGAAVTSLADSGVNSWITGNSFRNDVNTKEGDSNASIKEGTIQISEAPSAADYDKDMAGVTILRIDSTPSEMYFVRNDGNLTDPFTPDSP